MTPDLISRADVLDMIDVEIAHADDGSARWVQARALRRAVVALTAPPASPELRAWFDQLYRDRQEASCAKT